MSAAQAIVPWMWAFAEVAPATRPKLKPRSTAVQLAPVPQLQFYRKYTESMLRRYTRFAMESGRVPSMLGQEMFRSKVTSYQLHSFDDIIIFVHDVDRCLRQLGAMEQLLITRIGMQEYTHDETAGMMGLTRRTVVRRYAEAVDALTGIFLAARLLEPIKESQKCCQGGASPK